MGLRYGCPIFPYLLVLLIKYFEWDIKVAKRSNSIKWINFEGDDLLTQILFLDDVLLFTTNSLFEGKRLQESLQLCCRDTMMNINYIKSLIIFNNLEDDLQQEFREVFPFLVHYSLDTGLKYLEKDESWSKWIRVRINMKLTFKQLVLLDS